ISGTSAPTWPAWATTFAPSWPSVTEAAGQYRWFNRGPASDLTWTASTPYAAAGKVIVDVNGHGQTAYRPGISNAVGAPTFATTTSGLTVDNTTLTWINNGTTSAVTTFNFSARNAVISVTYTSPTSGSTRALTMDTITLPLTQN